MHRKNRTDRLLSAAACGFVLAVLLSFTGFSARCDALERNVLRLHIPANSDSAEDQSVKILVRDAVLEEAQEKIGNAEDFGTALAMVCTHLESIENAANAVLEAQGVPYRARAEVCDMWFPERVYETCRLPAGKYRTLRIALGAGTGQNWWCVVFPDLCVSGAGAVSDLPEGAAGAVAGESGMEVRFKAVEIFARLREFFDD